MIIRIIKDGNSNYKIQKQIKDNGPWETEHSSIHLDDTKRVFALIKESEKYKKKDNEVVEVIETVKI